MKSLKIFCLAALLPLAAWGYKPAGDKIMTKWGEGVSPGNVRAEYPRPLMKRTAWKSLNGLWQCAITPLGSATPNDFDREILVPFAVESALSGVGERVGKDSVVWYRRTFEVPQAWRGQDVMLRFEAVDWECDVWVNGVKVGAHKGGYTPFGMDITDALDPRGRNTLTVRVWDPTDQGYQPRGKQVSNPHGIWYTPVTGIWQSVWLEPVPKNRIEKVKITPDVDRRRLTVDVATHSDKPLKTKVKVLDAEGRAVAEGHALNGQAVEVEMPADARLWSPDDPYVYDLKIEALLGGKVVDAVDSYAAMRKFSSARDSSGMMRICINDVPTFLLGPLDQGWWPDGLYTAPTYDAMVYDLDVTKDLGYNMIRKHIKVEPSTWYEYCDRNGIVVWQDMPSGDLIPEWQNRNYFTGTELVRSHDSEECYRREWQEIIDHLYSHPCIAVWIPFNEAWGQFKTEEIAAWTRNYDRTRLVDPASGGNFFMCGHILDLHNYPGPDMFLTDYWRVNVLGEYGGIGYAVDGHLWNPDRNWGYIEFNTPEQVTDEYVKYAGQLLDLVGKGFSAGVYTQTSDVEIEVNGLMTYDRKVLKVDRDRVRQANDRLTHSLGR